MTWGDIESGWNHFKGRVQQQWDKLSEDEVSGTLGKRDYLATKVQEAYGVSQEEADRQITDWQSKQVEKSQPATNA
jgi:uncharacterized protein YjbJ (UPF0337 family)